MKFLKNLLHRAYWRFIGEIIIAGEFSGKPYVMRIKRGKLDKLSIPVNGSVEFLVADTRDTSSENFYFLKQIYEETD